MSLHDPEVETRDSAQQRARDDAALRSQLASLRERSPFYRDRLAEPVGLEDLPALPFTTKDELRASLAAERPLGRHLATPPERVRRIYSTSGTTGDPVSIAVTDDDLAGWAEIGARSYRACGIAPAQRAVLTYNAGPFVAGAVLDAWTRIGATVLPVGSGNTERLLKAFQLLDAEAVGCTPSYALYLADWCRERDIEPRSLGLRWIAGRGARRRRAADPARDRGGLRCHGPRGDGHRGRLALAVGRVRGAGRDALLRARLRPRRADRPRQRCTDSWEDGAEGELVYTSLRREAMPVVRFRSRDRVVVTVRPCSCGRTSVRVRCIGRTDDLLIVRGTNLSRPRCARSSPPSARASAA